MRPIKFRAWDKVNKRWIKLNDAVDIDNHGGIYPFARTDKGEVELMQYTGLKDKNGKEIYEGDVVKFGSNVGVVGFESGKFVVALKAKMATNSDVPSLCEVLGNIYENPELLKL